MSSDLPSWLQALAAFGSLGVTAWLARLTREYVRHTEKIATAGRAEDVAAASVLLEEVHRIRSELDPQPEGDEAPVIAPGVIVPSIHPWVHEVIPRLGRTDPTVVGLFMALGRHLRDLDRSFQSVLDARQELELVKKELTRTEEMAHEPPEKFGSTAQIIAANFAEARRKASVASENADRTLRMAAILYKQCHRDLDTMAERLRKLTT
jgi:hypothetical protein